jgi:hypothetical protein
MRSAETRSAPRASYRAVPALLRPSGELELGYDELKTELLDREELIRDKTRKGVMEPFA